MKLSGWKVLGGLLLMANLYVPAWSAPPPQPESVNHAATPLPGTVNYIEGQASIGAERLDAASAGSAELQVGQSLATGEGKAEVL